MALAERVVSQWCVGSKSRCVGPKFYLRCIQYFSVAAAQTTFPCTSVPLVNGQRHSCCCGGIAGACCCSPDSSGTSMRASQQDYSKPVDSLASHRAHKMSPSAAATRSASGLKLRSSPSRSMDSRATTGSRASGLHEGPIMESAASPTHSANSSAAANKE